MDSHKAILEIEMEEECLTCPMLELETEKIYYDEMPLELYHRCTHLDFCKSVRKNWDKIRKKREAAECSSFGRP